MINCRKYIVIATLMLIIICTIARRDEIIAQDNKVKSDIVSKTKDNQEQPSKINDSLVFLIVCDSDPSKMIALDADGKWISSVKSIDINIRLGGSSTIKCTMYEGSIAPSKPEVKSFALSQIKAVPSIDFQLLVDNLQSDPDAVKNFLKK